VLRKRAGLCNEPLRQVPNLSIAFEFVDGEGDAVSLALGEGIGGGAVSEFCVRGAEPIEDLVGLEIGVEALMDFAQGIETFGSCAGR